MPSRYGGPLRSPLAIVALVVYTLLLLGGPFLHSDAVCYGQSRSHCAVCAASHSIPAIEDPRLSSLHTMAVCGVASAREYVASPLLLTPRVTGRSPPA
jgi:hypothetical protein